MERGGVPEQGLSPYAALSPLRALGGPCDVQRVPGPGRDAEKLSSTATRPPPTADSSPCARRCDALPPALSTNLTREAHSQAGGIKPGFKPLLPSPAVGALARLPHLPEPRSPVINVRTLTAPRSRGLMRTEWIVGARPRQSHDQRQLPVTTPFDRWGH